MRSRGALALCTALLLAAVTLAPAAATGTGTGVDDPLRGLQYGLDRLDVEAAWAQARGRGVVVAIVDTGVNVHHEDLRDKIVGGRDFVDGGEIAYDRNGHGTHVAGIAVAGTDNARGIAGTAPDAMIMPLRVLDADGRGVESDVAGAIDFAVEQARERGLGLVVNLSLTDLGEIQGGMMSPLVGDAIRDAWFAGAVIVAAAGNEDLPYSDYPASGPNVLSVGATDQTDRRARFSNRGALVVAPGEGIVSTFWDPGSPNDDAAYASGSGTSMAAPFVSGTAALLGSAGLSNEEIVHRIIATADPLGDELPDPEYGYGRVNAGRALGVVSAGTGAADRTVEAPPEGATRFEKIDSELARVPDDEAVEGGGPPARRGDVGGDPGGVPASRPGALAAAVVSVGLALTLSVWRAVARR